MSEEKPLREKVQQAIEAKKARVLSKFPKEISELIHNWGKARIKKHLLYFHEKDTTIDLLKIIEQKDSNLSDTSNQWISNNQNLIHEYFDLEHKNNLFLCLYLKLYFDPDTLTLPCGTKTTLSYDFCHYFSETRLHKFFLFLYDFEPPDKASLNELLICSVLLLPMAFTYFLIWPVVVACVGAILLSIGLGIATRYVKNYPDREVIVIEQPVFEVCEKEALLEIQKQLATRQSKSKEKRKTRTENKNETIHPSPVSQTPTELVHERLETNHLKSGQENYAAVRALSTISNRLAQVKDNIDNDSIKTAIQQLLIFNPASARDDQSFLQYSTKDKAKIDALDHLITHLFPDIEEICQTENDKNGNWTLTISNEKAKEILSANDFTPETFSDSFNKKPSTTNT